MCNVNFDFAAICPLDFGVFFSCWIFGMILGAVGLQER